MSLNNWRANAIAVNHNGTFTNTAISALQPSFDDFETVSAQSLAAEVQAVLYLPSSQSITLTRNNQSITFTSTFAIVNPGDIITLASTQTIKIQPL